MLRLGYIKGLFGNPSTNEHGCVLSCSHIILCQIFPIPLPLKHPCSPSPPIHAARCPVGFNQKRGDTREENKGKNEVGEFSGGKQNTQTSELHEVIEVYLSHHFNPLQSTERLGMEGSYSSRNPSYSLFFYSSCALFANLS